MTTPPPIPSIQPSSSSLTTSLDSLIRAIECKICCELTSSIRALPCGHSLCEKCIELTTEEGKNFKCHFCNKKSKTPKNGFPKNFSINDISDALRLVPMQCPKHLFFSMNMKCMTCPDHPIVCLQCYQLEHLGHYLIPSDWTMEYGLNVWKLSYHDSENLIPPSVTLPPPKESQDISTQTDDIDLKTHSNYLQSIKSNYQRGDCILYLYRSSYTGDICLGLAVVHRMITSSQISARYHFLQQELEDMETTSRRYIDSGRGSYSETLERKLKRKRVDECYDECNAYDIVLKVSPLKIETILNEKNSTPSSTTSSSFSFSFSDTALAAPNSNESYLVVVTPSNSPLVDIPQFSVISSNITILLSGLISF